MKVNEGIAVSTSKILLVPYEARHVPLYHQWMTDPKIQEATASEPLSFGEELENQKSWRTSIDKLTFILCQPSVSASGSPVSSAIIPGNADSSANMLGDINLFLTEVILSDSDDEGATVPGSGSCCTGGGNGCHSHNNPDEERLYTGEIDVMVATSIQQGKGNGTAAVRTMLHYISQNEARIVAEASQGGEGKIMSLEARIKENNDRSRRLFSRLGFVQRGAVNYFGEIKMVCDRSWRDIRVDGYKEVPYMREG
ncbi:hypothetical protein Cpir12675_001332 [Ceratocystis pirilliformis]|uniref:N-acetyltransferase domain-containing protein n=1 Tax=Ceratocystis pirilliformis TaxID=259994 RepID=A0ABR3ZHM1_9PEZI